MKKQVYISADYSEADGDRDVVETLNRWGQDDYHVVNFIDMSKVSSGSVSADPDCRICDLKAEINRQINASSAVIFVVGNKTAIRAAGSSCQRASQPQYMCYCTPYKQNTNGTKPCKVSFTSTPGPEDNYGNVNDCSYLQHEFEQAKKKKKQIVIVYNSTRNEPSWLPDYMDGYENCAFPFWTSSPLGWRVGNYTRIKEVLGF